MKKPSLISIIIMVPLFLGTSWYLFKKHAQKSKNPYTLETPAQRDLTQFITASGNLKARDQISVGSLVAGKVAAILAEDNDTVKKDQVLAMLDNGIGDTAVKRLNAQLAEAHAQLTYQEQFYKRQEALFKSGQLAKNLFEQYTQNYEVAKARVDQTKAQLEIEKITYNNLFIKSPDNGIVIARKINLGQMVTAQLDATVLFEIAKDLHHMEAYIDIDEADIGMAKEGQEATFTVDAFPKETFAAKVKRIQYQSKVIDNVITYATVLDVSNPDLKLRPGMTTNVDVKVAHAPQALSISNKAFRLSALMLEQAAKKYGHTLKKLSDGSKNIGAKQIKTRDTLWILENQNTIKQIEVNLSINDGKFTQISNGIDTSAQVIVDIEGLKQENAILKGAFGSARGIGR